MHGPWRKWSATIGQDVDRETDGDKYSTIEDFFQKITVGTIGN